MDEEILGQYIRLWRLVRALQEKDYPPEIEEEARAAIVSFARGLGVELEETDPRFLQAVEKALTDKIDDVLKAGAPPPNIPPNLRELVKIHQEHLAKEAEESLKTAGIPTIKEQIEKIHQHTWQTEVKEKVLLGRDRKATVPLADHIDDLAEPEISEEEQIQERVYQILRENRLLDDVGQPNPEILKNPTPEQATSIANAQKELASRLHFDELARFSWRDPGYPTHVYWALEEAPVLFLFPERHRRLAIKLGREYAQEVTDHFYESWSKAWEETQGDLGKTREAARRAVETLTADLFQNPVRLKETVTKAVNEVFKPLTLPDKERAILVEQTIESLQGYGRRYLTPLTNAGRKTLETLLPSLPKEVLLDVDPQGQPRLRVNPLDQPQNEKIYWSEPTRQGLISQTIKALRGPFGNDAYYFQFQLESFLSNPIGTVIYWTALDPAIGALEIIPGVQRLRLGYINFQMRKGELLRWYHLTPQLKYLAFSKIKETLGVWTGFYRKTPTKPVLTPMAWLGKLSTAPFRKGAEYFFFRGRRARGRWTKRFWIGLGKAFRRREQDWDRNPLVLLIKLALDLTVGVVVRLVKKATFALGARLGARVMSTSWGQRLFSHSAIRGLRAGMRLGGKFIGSFISTNAVSGGFLGFVFGGYFGYPMHGLALGWAGGGGYQFYLSVAQDEWLLRWLAQPSGKYNILARGIRYFLGRPAGWLATHPYARFPLRGLAFGYLLYLFGAPPWVIPLSMGAEWAWITRGWWGPRISPFFEGLPGLSKLAKLFGVFGRFFGLVGRVLAYAGPLITALPLIWDLAHGVPLPIALQRWFGAHWFYSGQATIAQAIFLTRSWWWPLLKAGVVKGWALLTGPILEATTAFFSTLWASIAVFIATYGIIAVFTIVFFLTATVWMLYLWAGAFFQGREMVSHIASPYLPLEKTVAVSEINDKGEITALDYTLTFTYNPPDGVVDPLGNIQVFDTYEDLFQMRLDLNDMFYLPPIMPGERPSTFSPCSPDYLPGRGNVNTFVFVQEENPPEFPIGCHELGPLSPGESRTLTLHLFLKKPLNQFLSGDQMLCNTMSVFGQIQGGERLSSSSPPICINAAGETWIFGWPTCYHNCSSNYGYRPDPFQRHVCEFHEGIDIPPEPPEPPGGCTDIHPSARGVIVKQGRHSGYGCYVIIQHRENLYTLYAHLEDEYSCDFPKNKDDEVSPSDIIGIMDNSGHSTSNHLHFGVSSCGTISCFLNNPEDPCGYLPGCPGNCLYQARRDCEGSPLL
jgi:hypothetical protein